MPLYIFQHQEVGHCQRRLPHLVNLVVFICTDNTQKHFEFFSSQQYEQKSLNLLFLKHI